MIPDLIGYILLGLIGGFSEFVPVSASANQYLFSTFFGLDDGIELVSAMIHIGCMVTIFMKFGRRIGHLYRQMRIATMPARRRKRQPDGYAVLDSRVIMGSWIPMAVSLVLSKIYATKFYSLPILTAVLILTGILVYIPQHFPGGNRESRGMSRMDGWLFGLASGLAVLPGMSRLGGILCVGLLRGCERRYILDMAYIICVPALAAMAALEILSIVLSGFMGITLLTLLGGILAGLAAFAASYGAVSFMQYLSVRAGFSNFAFYSWGLAMLTFILYLMT